MSWGSSQPLEIRWGRVVRGRLRQRVDGMRRPALRAAQAFRAISLTQVPDRNAYTALSSRT